MYPTHMRRKAGIAAAVLLSSVFSLSAIAGGRKSSPDQATTRMLRALGDQTKFFKYPAKPGPYRIALANGFIGNTWQHSDDQDRQGLMPRQPDVRRS